VDRGLRLDTVPQAAVEVSTVTGERRIRRRSHALPIITDNARIVMVLLAGPAACLGTHPHPQPSGPGLIQLRTYGPCGFEGPRFRSTQIAYSTAVTAMLHVPVFVGRMLVGGPGPV
jgi:hypothetical protein